jgi:hypothetical protein
VLRKHSALNPAPKPPPRKPKGLIRQLLRKLEIYMAQKPPAAQVDEYMENLQSSFRTQVAATFAMTIFAKKILDATRQVELPFPEAYFDGAAPVDDAGRATLVAYAEALQKFLHVLEDDNAPLSTTVARGLPTWIASCYALADPALFEKGREIWQRLTENQEGLDEAFRMQMKREPSEVERVYFQYRPKVFFS